MLDVGLIGAGGIGSNLAQAVTDGRVPDARLTSVYNRTPERARDLVADLDTAHDVAVVEDAVAVARRADVVVEAAGQTVVEESATGILDAGADLVVMSVGAFRDASLLEEVRAAAEANDARVRVPSGAIAGLDGVAAIGTGTVEAVSLLCRRRPEHLGAYVDDDVVLQELPEGKVIFEGTAAEAAEAFPSHMNVALALTLTARVDPEDVTVRIEVERDAPRSRYFVRSRGSAGTVEVEIENFRTAGEPDTSRITVGSTVETLRRLSERVVVGT